MKKVVFLISFLLFVGIRIEGQKLQKVDFKKDSSFLSLFGPGALYTPTNGPTTTEDDKVPSSYTYSTGYTGPKKIQDQINLLAKIFHLDPSKALENAKNLPALPKGAEGWFAVVRWESIAKVYFWAIDSIYGRLGMKMPQGKVGIRKISVMSINTIATVQNNSNILIIPAQFGLKHRGEATEYAKKNLAPNEFGLDLISVGCMLLTHPKRLCDTKSLEFDILGSAILHKRILFVPVIYFDKKLVLNADDGMRTAKESSGSPTGFLLEKYLQ